MIETLSFSHKATTFLNSSSVHILPVGLCGLQKTNNFASCNCLSKFSKSSLYFLSSYINEEYIGIRLLFTIAL